MVTTPNDIAAGDKAQLLQVQCTTIEQQLRDALSTRRASTWVWLFRALRYAPASVGCPPWVAALAGGSIGAVLLALFVMRAADPGFVATLSSLLLSYAIFGGGIWLLLRDAGGENDENRKSARHRLMSNAEIAQLAAVAQVQRLQEDLATSRKNLQAILRSIGFHAEQLLAVNLDALHPDDFESFVAQVFQHLGYAVQQTGKTGDQGVDVIAERPGCRLAVQAKHYANSVGNAAVQEVFAGMVHHNCDRCVVFTTNYFTNSARALATSTGCVLIDRDRIPAVIRGQIKF